ncbi:hypothetical protein GCM10025880_14760 [Methylorubrum aminovorans]|uniref:hypothetical protein n=1 Tax=Methylorubrum aminovorans TaxID=269069 RepID=UPI0023E9FCF2|nr:hypothetical protein [Methylorubrum aminovorans]GMA75059.1 hypothetical protein GCM10025880_14760 [Methylorubrum aminovorans]
MKRRDDAGGLARIDHRRRTEQGRRRRILGRVAAGEIEAGQPALADVPGKPGHPGATPIIGPVRGEVGGEIDNEGEGPAGRQARAGLDHAAGQDEGNAAGQTLRPLATIRDEDDDILGAFVPAPLARVLAPVSVSRFPHRSSIGRKARGGREAVSWPGYIKSVAKSFALSRSYNPSVFEQCIA